MSEIVKFQDNHNSNSGFSEISTPEYLISSFFLYLDCSEQTVRTYRYGIKQFMKYLKAGNTSKPTRETILSYKKELTSRSGYDSPRLTAHSLRHSAATLALLAGVELTDVSAFMRHSNIGVIMVYAHNVNRLKSLCESAITRAIFGERLSA